MSHGLRWIVIALSALALAPTVVAAENPPQVRCKICVIRVSDDCYEKMKADASCDRAGSCCPAKCAEAKCTPENCTEGKCCQTKCPASERSCCEAKQAKVCCEAKCAPSAAPFALLPSTVSDRLAQRWIALVKGCEGCEVVCCPQVTTEVGRPASVCLQSQQFFVTNVDTQWLGGRAVEFPVNEQFSTGCLMNVRATLPGDRTVTLLSFDAHFTELDGETQVFPVPPVCYPGNVPTSNVLQLPSLTTRGIRKVVACREGQTVVLDAGRRTCAVERETGCELLGSLPVIGELFRCKSTDVVSDRLVVLVTPCVCEGGAYEACPAAAAMPGEMPLFAAPVMCGDHQQPGTRAPACHVNAPERYTNGFIMRPMPCGAAMAQPPVVAVEYLPVMPRPVQCAPCPPVVAPGVFVAAPTRTAPCAVTQCSATGNGQLVNLMIEYYEACSAGETAKARNLAARCIALDPMCFAK